MTSSEKIDLRGNHGVVPGMTFPRLAASVLLSLVGCATLPSAPAKLTLTGHKGAVFDAALLTLQEWGENILTADRSGGILTTRPKEMAVREQITLNYRITLWVKEPKPDRTQVEVQVRGEKHFTQHRNSHPVDASDPDVRSITNGLLGSIQSKIHPEE